MRDINFFTPYKGNKGKQEVNEEASNKTIIITGIVVVAIIFISLVVNIVRLKLLNNSIDDINDKLTSTTLKHKLAESEQVNKELDVLNKYDSSLVSIGSSIDNRDVVSNDILNQLSSVLPSDVSFKSFNIAPGTITVQAVSKSRQAIGEVEHNLRNQTNVSSVYINSISGGEAVEGQYSFDIKVILKGAK